MPLSLRIVQPVNQVRGCGGTIVAGKHRMRTSLIESLMQALSQACWLNAGIQQPTEQFSSA
jgi:hypothetical protein